MVCGQLKPSGDCGHNIHFQSSSNHIFVKQFLVFFQVNLGFASFFGCFCINLVIEVDIDIEWLFCINFVFKVEVDIECLGLIKACTKF